MRCKKRGAEESFSFLIGILIFIMIITPFIIVGYRACAAKNAAIKCFDDIVKASKDLKEGEEKVLACSFHPDFALLGFDKDEDVLNTGFPVAVFNPTLKALLLGMIGGDEAVISTMNLLYEKPKSACLDKELGCLCICSSKEHKVIVTASEGKPGGQIKCTGKIKCAQFPKITHISGISTRPGGPKNTGNLFFWYKGLQGFSIKKINNLLLICASNAGGCELTTEFFSINVDDLKKAMEKCKTSSEGLCSFQISAPSELIFKLKSYDAATFSVIYHKKGEEGIAKVLQGIGKAGEICTYDKDKKKKLVLTDVDVEYELDGLKFYKAGNDVCFLGQAEVKPAAPAATKADYNEGGKQVLGGINKCKQHSEQKCVCDFEIDISKFISSEYINKVTKVYYDLWYKRYEDKYHRYLVYEFHAKQSGAMGELLATDVGKNACVFDGTNKIVPQPGKKYRMEGLKLVKIGSDVCFSSEANAQNLPKCSASGTVSLR